MGRIRPSNQKSVHQPLTSRRSVYVGGGGGGEAGRGQGTRTTSHAHGQLRTGALRHQDPIFRGAGQRSSKISNLRSGRPRERRGPRTFAYRDFFTIRAGPRRLLYFLIY